MNLLRFRPPIPSEVEQYEWEDRRRLSMKPGITCLWQIKVRSTITFEHCLGFRISDLFILWTVD